MSAEQQASRLPPQGQTRARLRLNQSLAIDGLPPSLAALATGQVYAVYASRSPARDALFWKTAASALLTPVTVMSTHPPEDIALALKQHGLDIDQPGTVHPRSNVVSLRLPSNRDGCDVLIEALQALSEQCASPGTQFLLEGTAACFAWNDRATLKRQGAALAAWCAQSRHTVLLVMLPPLVEHGEGFLPLTDFQVHFGGAAQLMQVQGEYRWEVAFWRDNNNALSAYESIALRFSPTDHRLMAAGDAMKERTERTGLIAPDEMTVMVSRDAVQHERQLPKDWQVFADNEALVAAASQAVAATVILHYGIRTNLATLAKEVNLLRRTCGKALKILIREDNVSIRYELLFLTLGANAIIPRSTSIAQAEIAVDSVQGQLFSRAVPEDYRAALSAAMRDSTTGYVPAQRFVALVREAVERSRTIRLPNVLFRMLLEPDVASLDALQACKIRRAGDLCTASGDSLYVFFFACHVDDVGKAMQTVFNRPPADLFRGELRCGDPETIYSMLDSLEEEITELPPPDYSTLVDAVAPVAAPSTEASTSASGEKAGTTEESTSAASAEPAKPADVPLWGLSELEAQEEGSTTVTNRPPRPTLLPLKARG